MGCMHDFLLVCMAVITSAAVEPRRLRAWWRTGCAAGLPRGTSWTLPRADSRRACRAGAAHRVMGASLPHAACRYVFQSTIAVVHLGRVNVSSDWLSVVCSLQCIALLFRCATLHGRCSVLVLMFSPESPAHPSAQYFSRILSRATAFSIVDELAAGARVFLPTCTHVDPPPLAGCRARQPSPPAQPSPIRLRRPPNSHEVGEVVLGFPGAHRLCLLGLAARAVSVSNQADLSALRLAHATADNRPQVCSKDQDAHPAFSNVGRAAISMVTWLTGNADLNTLYEDAHNPGAHGPGASPPRPRPPALPAPTHHLAFVAVVGSLLGVAFVFVSDAGPGVSPLCALCGRSCLGCSHQAHNIDGAGCGDGCGFPAHFSHDRDAGEAHSECWPEYAAGQGAGTYT